MPDLTPCQHYGNHITADHDTHDLLIYLLTAVPALIHQNIISCQVGGLAKIIYLISFSFEQNSSYITGVGHISYCQTVFAI